MREPYGSSPFERAEQLVDRRRLLIGLCVAVAVALIAAVVGVLSGGGGDKSVRATGAATAGTTTTAVDDGAVSPELGVPMPTVPPASSTTTQPPSVLGTSFTQVPTTTTPKAGGKAAPRTGTPPTTAAPTTSGCHDSYDQACGAFRWDPAPAQDQPEQVSITPSATTVRVGENVDFTVNISDPDNNHFVECAFSWDYGDGPGVMTTHCDPAPGSNPCPTRYGPWTPPAPSAGNEEFKGIGHSWSAPGKYTVTYTHDSRPNSCYNPYASTGTGTATITVIP